MMETASIVGFLQESFFMLLVFGCFLIYTIATGRQSITNIILGLYFALLISLEFPFYETIMGATNNAKTQSILTLLVFGSFAVTATILFSRLMPREYSEKKFEGLWKKLLLAAGATVLVMAFSYHALPVTDLITPGSPIQYLFGSENSFFYWLLVPIIILFLT